MRARREAGRLAAGCHLYRGTDGDWRCALPDGRFVRVPGPDALLRSLQRELHGHAAPATGDPATAAELLARFAQRGMLAGEPVADQVGRALADRIVHVEGDNPVAALAADLLASRVTVIRGRIEPASLVGLDLVVSCAGWLPDARWRLLDRWCAERGVPWHRSYAEGLRFYVGPCTLPGRTASYTDTRARRLAAVGLADELAAHWAYLDAGLTAGEGLPAGEGVAAGEVLPAVPWPSPGCVALIAGLLVADVLAWLAGDRVPSEGHQLEVDPAEVSVRRHPVLPLPDPQCPAGQARSGHRPAGALFPAAERLIDPRLGVITRVDRCPGPTGTLRSCVAYHAQVSATSCFAPWSADREASGAAFADDERARQAAIGEAVERYCGNAVPEDLLRTSFAKLAAAGREAVDPDALALYSATQYRTRGFPFVPMTRDLELVWVPGWNLLTGDEVLVPASLVYLNYHRQAGADEPATSVQAFGGIAAGAGVEAAARSALEELLERDAVTIWWASGAPATGIELPQRSRLRHLLADPDGTGLAVSFFRIPSSFPVPVVAAFLTDDAHRVVALGTACRASAEDAAVKALTEAVASHRLSLELLDPACEFWRAVAASRLDPAPYRPYRADRSYRDCFRADWRDITDMSLHLQLYLDPRMQGEQLRRLRTPPARTPLGRLPGVAQPPLDSYLTLLAARGLQAVAVDLTTRDVAAVGFRVVRVVVPGLYGVAPGAFPLLGGRRLYAEPVERGWVPGPLTEQNVITTPIPFA